MLSRKTMSVVVYSVNSYIYPMANIDTLLLDFGNVIIDLDVEGATQRLQALRRTDVDEQEGLQALKMLVYAFDTGRISSEDFIGYIQKVTRPEVRPEQIVEAWNSMLVGIPRYRLAMLEALKENYTVFLLSNTNALHLDWVYDHLDKMHGVRDWESQLFHGTYLSHLIGKRKPDADIFEHVIEDAFLTPDRTLFIDDKAENIHTAETLGFKTHLSPPGEEIAEYLKLEGYY